MLSDQDRHKVQKFLNDLQVDDGAMLKDRLFGSYALNTFEELLVLLTGRTKPDVILFVQETVRNMSFDGSVDEAGGDLLAAMEDWL